MRTTQLAPLFALALSAGLALGPGCSESTTGPVAGTPDATAAPDAGGEDAGAPDLGTAADAGPGADAALLPLPPIGTGTTPVLPAAGEAEHLRFTTAPSCARCHSNVDGTSAMRDPAGRPVAPFDLWQGSMMANASRDPIYRAGLSIELASNPGLTEVLEAKCLGCHAPMGTRAEPSLGLAELYAGGDAAQLGLDGVSCTTCHRIVDEGLGEERTFGGRFELDPGNRIYGPHAQPFARPMLNDSGFIPVEGAWLRDSGLCGTCHTLFTDTVDASGAPTGDRLPEQVPLLEWRNSSFPAAGQSCQSCHLPTTDEDGQPIETRIARTPNGGEFPPTVPRSPYGRHLLVGGNTLGPRLLREFADELRPRASAAALEATEAAARHQLESRTAGLSLDLARDGESLTATVRIDNATGHKLPTGHPIRRMWLRLRLERGDGTVVFRSGEVDAYGRLLGPDGLVIAADRVGGPIEPHRDTLEPGDGPQIYESFMADADGRPTTLLLRGARYAKDNRLLPSGWRADHPDAPATLPVGTDGDADFEGGRDTVRYRLPAPSAEGPYTVEVALLYQTVSGRWYAEMAEWDTPEVRAFRRYFEARPRPPETIDRARVRE